MPLREWAWDHRLAAEGVLGRHDHIFFFFAIGQTSRSGGALLPVPRPRMGLLR